jgi:hypothetical protein
VNRERCDYITRILELDVSQENKLYFLVDSVADIGLVKSYKLLGTAEFEPKDRVRVKSVEGSVIETCESIETRIWERETDIPFRLELVSQQVDLEGDGILGRVIFKLTQVRIPDFSARRVCNTQRITILTGARNHRFTEGSRR